MFNCTTDRYAELYAQWLENPGTLLDLAGWEPGMSLLDLCGGTGAVTREALRRGAKVSDIVLLDLNPRAADTGVIQVACSAEEAGHVLYKQQFDVVVCRQAFAYLQLNDNLVRSLYCVLKPGGKLVFNTFVRPRWVFKTYRHGGRRYLEASGYLGGLVGHIQASPGVGVDVTRFRWHQESLITKRFQQHFQVQADRSVRSIRWVCRRRP